MGQVFGSGKKKPAITEIDKAVLTLKTQRRKLEDYQKRVEAVIARETEMARELVKAKRRDRAILCLKKKKVQEDMLVKSRDWILNVEKQLADIEVAVHQKAVFESLKSGHAAIKELQTQISMEDVEQLLDDSAEASSYLRDLEGTLGSELSAEDEEDISAELAALETDLGLDSLDELEEGTAEKLPSVPSRPVKVPEEEEEEEEELPSVPRQPVAAKQKRRERDCEEPLAA